jgi:hypothetical protein
MERGAEPSEAEAVEKLGERWLGERCPHQIIRACQLNARNQFADPPVTGVASNLKRLALGAWHRISAKLGNWRPAPFLRLAAISTG